jgi:hypothetical protein
MKDREITVIVERPNSRTEIVVKGQIKSGRLIKLIGRIWGGK